jgi:hypothetical protein
MRDIGYTDLKHEGTWKQKLFISDKDVSSE